VNDASEEKAGISIESYPLAVTQSVSEVRNSFVTKIWWLTGLSAVVSLLLWWSSSRTAGDLIEIEFQQGYGLKPEDRISYRGIDVGVVEKVSLTTAGTRVAVHARLTPETRKIANEGAKFWIVRPSVSIDSIQGLETIIGAKYIAVEPGPNSSKRQRQFVGLETPPVVAPPDGALEIVLDGRTRGGLENGAPILFRGFAIGRVIQVGLASDARTVRARCAIDPEYRELVRKNTKFWNRSGWRLDIGLSGIKLDADTLAQIVSGGIELATPPDLGAAASTGHRFVLHDKAEPEWLAWQPSIPFGSAWSKLEARLPQPTRIALRWQERSFGFRTNRQAVAWCLPLSDGGILSHAEQVVAPKSAIGDSSGLEIAGVACKPDQLSLLTVEGTAIPAESASGIVRWKPVETLPSDLPRWNISDLVPTLPNEPCNVVVAHSDANGYVAIDAARLQASGTFWKIDDSISLVQDLHGLPVVSEESRKVLGLLSVKDGTAVILPLGGRSN
jgi:paraquat-inducible protein B